MRAPDPLIGRTLLDGRFEVLEKIGAGGMGVVYRARQVDMNRLVAIKILLPALTEREDVAARFRREARTMSQLSHPHNTRVYLFGELPESGALFVVLEHLEGRTLHRRVRREGPLSQRAGATVLTCVAGALQEAHDLGIVHRDLKPENVFLARQGGIADFPKLLDFGLARVTPSQMAASSLELTRQGMVFGTPEFMSPEQARGDPVDHRSDLYALGLILYEALTTKLPFEARSPLELVRLHAEGDPIPLSARIPGLRFDPDLEAVVMRAFASDPDQRWQSARAFAEALAPFAVPISTLALLERRDERAVDAGSGGGGLEAPVSTPRPTRPATPSVLPQVPLPLVLLIAAGCLVLGIALALALVALLG